LCPEISVTKGKIALCTNFGASLVDSLLKISGKAFDSVISPQNSLLSQLLLSNEQKHYFDQLQGHTSSNVILGNRIEMQKIVVPLNFFLNGHSSTAIKCKHLGPISLEIKLRSLGDLICYQNIAQQELQS
jgi:hypothetical protein